MTDDEREKAIGDLLNRMLDDLCNRYGAWGHCMHYLKEMRDLGFRPEFLLAQNGIECGETGIGQLYWSCGLDTWYAKGLQGDLLSVEAVMTPMQVAENALGHGECVDVCASISEFTCSRCGFNCDLTSWISLFDGDDGRHRHHHHGTPNFCPNCGRKVKR